jgi:hypothetical protein
VRSTWPRPSSATRSGRHGCRNKVPHLAHKCSASQGQGTPAGHRNTRGAAQQAQATIVGRRERGTWSSATAARPAPPPHSGGQDLLWKRDRRSELPPCSMSLGRFTSRLSLRSRLGYVVRPRCPRPGMRAARRFIATALRHLRTPAVGLTLVDCPAPESPRGPTRLTVKRHAVRPNASASLSPPCTAMFPGTWQRSASVPGPRARPMPTSVWPTPWPPGSGAVPVDTSGPPRPEPD